MGVFDGNGKTISNFSYTSTGADSVGLFAYVYGEQTGNAVIKNLGLIDPNVDVGLIDPDVDAGIDRGVGSASTDPPQLLSRKPSPEPRWICHQGRWDLSGRPTRGRQFGSFGLRSLKRRPSLGLGPSNST